VRAEVINRVARLIGADADALSRIAERHLQGEVHGAKDRDTQKPTAKIITFTPRADHRQRRR
jgi:hypothetical protein